ncbi:hypothetical protein NIES2111_56960 (plasmid) [Nostoc sp. NIES-2111]|nr:hypothetical protein NIES2111_56960 [Nostoc sp. NIES-2111]
MTYQTYSHQQLQHKSIAGLKQIYDELGCTVEITKRYSKNAWINAIAQHQAQHIHRIPPAALDEQAIAQEELENFIARQAEELAPEELTTVEINPHHFEVFAGKRLVAYISYDHENVTQPWVVMVCGEEKFRHFAISQCHRFIDWHYLDGTLKPLSPAEVPEAPTVQEISFYDQEVVVEGEPIASVEFDDHNYQDLYWRVMVNGNEIYRDTTPARCHSYVKQLYQQGMLLGQEEFFPLHPTPCPVSSPGNRIMAHIFNECQKYGFEILNDGIYKDGIKLGQVGCTNGNWWVILGCSGEAQYSYSVFDAVRSLTTSFEDQLDTPFDQLSSHEWLLLMESDTQSKELVAV